MDEANYYRVCLSTAINKKPLVNPWKYSVSMKYIHL